MTKRKDPSKPPRIRMDYDWDTWMNGHTHVLRRGIELHPTRKMIDIRKTIWQRGTDLDRWIDLIVDHQTDEYLIMRRTNATYEKGLAARKAGRVPPIKLHHAFALNEWSDGRLLEQGVDFQLSMACLLYRIPEWQEDVVQGRGTVSVVNSATKIKVKWNIK